MIKILLLILSLTSILANPEYIQKRKDFYQKIINETYSKNIILDNDEAGLYVKLFSKNNDTLPSNSTIITIHEKYVFSGCNIC